MSQLIHAVVVWLTYPPVLSGAVLLCAALAMLLKWRRLAGGLAAVGLAWTLLWSVPIHSDWLRRTLERQNAIVPEASLPRADAIVVLGGGSHKTWLDRGEDVDPAILRSSRLAAGARAWLAGRAPVVVLSGGGRPGRTEALGMARAITRLGVPDDVLVLEERSRNTEQNAQFTAELARLHHWSQILLVTSALHMPRARQQFVLAGIQVIPVPVPEGGPRRGWKERWIPSRRALWRSGRAFKEYAALLGLYVETRLERGPPATAPVAAGQLG